MATYVEYQMRDSRWSELKPQVERNDSGNSHARMLDAYMRMLGEYRRVMDSRKRGFDRFDPDQSRSVITEGSDDSGNRGTWYDV